VKTPALALVLTLGVTVATTAQAQIRSEVAVSGLSQLVGYVADPVVPGVFYAVQQSGTVRVVQNGAVLPTPFLDLSTQISTGGEQGLLGFVFAPNVGSGRVFVNYTNTQGHTVIARFRRTPQNPLVADLSSRFDLRWPGGEPFIRQPFANHNGGHLAFGPDGYLYIGLGDGGSGNDPFNNAQNPDSLLGKMLRIDVNVPDGHATGYQVPPDNPFVDGNPIAALDEIWDFGLRNPWRYSFDDPALGGTGALFIGDVGQGQREEVNYEPAGSGARNYGWSLREGATRTPGVPAERPVGFLPLTEPLFDYERSIGTTVTGGYVYRGALLGSQYVGRYFVADYGAGRVWSVRWLPSSNGSAVVTDVLEHTAELGNLGPISSFGVDLSGELYIVIMGSGSTGRVLRIVAGPTAPEAPRDLSAQALQGSGRDVTLNWTASQGAAQYRIEVGSRPGATDILQYNTGSSVPSLTAQAVPDGIYHVRVRALNGGGASPPSNEVVVAVGCSSAPAPPTSFTYALTGQNVALNWAAAGDLTSVVLEVGSGPSLADIAVFALPGTARSIGGGVPPRTYYARLRAMNACGASAPSSEVTVTVQ
jgi:glucose/arabinose dehydrogenase